MVFTLLTFLTVLAIGNWDHNALPNHPSFWPITTTAAERDTVAKHFNAGRGTNGALPVNREEVWSQSLPSEEGEDYRYVRYLTPVGGGWDQWEWEHFYYDWSDDQSVTVSQFGGENEATSNRVYANRYLCLADTNNTGNYSGGTQTIARLTFPEAPTRRVGRICLSDHDGG